MIELWGCDMIVCVPGRFLLAPLICPAVLSEQRVLAFSWWPPRNVGSSCSCIFSRLCSRRFTQCRVLKQKFRTIWLLVDKPQCHAVSCRFPFNALKDFYVSEIASRQIFILCTRPPCRKWWYSVLLQALASFRSHALLLIKKQQYTPAWLYSHWKPSIQ